MRREKQVFEVEYNVFDPGEIVTPASSRCPLPQGGEFEVVSCHPPLCPDDSCVVFVKGHQHGVDACYLQPVPVPAKG